MISKSQIIYKWEEPEKLRTHKVSEQIKSAKRFILRTAFFVIPILILLYVFFKIYSPDSLDVNWERLFLIMLAGSLISSFAIFLQPLETRYLKRSLVISDKGISRNNFLLYWKQIKGYWLSQHEHLPELKLVKIINRGHIFTFVLPEDGSAQKIIVQTLEQKIPYIDLPDRPEVIKLSKSHLLYFSTLTVAYSLLATFLIVKTHNIVFFVVVIWLSIFFGPGFISCLLVFGKKYWKNHSLRKNVAIFNAASFLIIILLTILFGFYRLSNQTLPFNH